jgi:hypothetical protein
MMKFVNLVLKLMRDCLTENDDHSLKRKVISITKKSSEINGPCSAMDQQSMTKMRDVNKV